MKFSIKDFFSKCDQICINMKKLHGKINVLCSEKAILEDSKRLWGD